MAEMVMVSCLLVLRSWGILLLLLFASSSVNAAKEEEEFHSNNSCETDDDCASVAVVTGTTTTSTSGEMMKCIYGSCVLEKNPFLDGGCLHQRKPNWKRMRVCNSEDPPYAHEKGYCRQPPLLSYEEVRIGAQNWESANFASWILQILLNEMLDVPATIETGLSNKVLNFYDVSNRFEYGTANDWEALRLANQVGDCRRVAHHNEHNHNNNPQNDDDETTYQACAHVVLEVWASNHQDALTQLVEDEEIEHPSGLGALGEMGWYLPKFAAQKDPSFLSYLGMMGEENRHKLAETFLTPTTWRDYCLLVSNTSCEVPDNVAQRAPLDQLENDRMFVQGQYTGYFRKAAQNDCEQHPTNCTGHFADYPCDWGSYFEAQAYHFDIAASSPRYTYGQLVDIIKAGNATQSPFMLYWWTPEALLQSFRGSSTEMIRIGLPSPTQSCLNSRILPTKRCESEVINSPTDVRFGSSEGACDEAPQNLQKVIATSLKKQQQSTATSASEAVEKQSPAYDAIVNFKINDLNFADFVESWFGDPNQDPREAACDWLVNNFEVVQSFVPNSYPRILMAAPTALPLFYVALVGGSCALILGFAATILVAQRRNNVIMVYSQVEFLFLLLIGGILVALGSLINLLEPSDVTCITVVWLVAHGYTLLLVPLIVKVAAMNRLMRAARKFRRVVLTRRQLFGAVAAIEALVILYLIIWTTIDAPRKQAQYELTDTQTEEGDYVVYVGYHCDSNSMGWRIGSVAWNFLLIVCATIFAFVTRTFESQFRETQTLAFMIYSHFIFAILRFLVVLWNSNKSDLRLVQSIIYSFDICATVVIYFVPKFLATSSDPRLSDSARNSMMFSNTNTSADRLQFSMNTVCRHCGKNPFTDPSTKGSEEYTPENTATGLPSRVEAVVGSFASESVAAATTSGIEQAIIEVDGGLPCEFDSQQTHPCEKREASRCCDSSANELNADDRLSLPVVVKKKRKSWHPQCQGTFLDEDLDQDETQAGKWSRQTWHPNRLAQQLALLGDLGDDEER